MTIIYTEQDIDNIQKLIDKYELDNDRDITTTQRDVLITIYMATIKKGPK